jgi:hypothetical protein
MTRLIRFISELSADPRRLAKFRKNPRAAMKRAKLTSEEKKAILSGNPRRIRAAMGFVFWGRGDLR